jgi:hypothetical protein
MALDRSELLALVPNNRLPTTAAICFYLAASIVMHIDFNYFFENINIATQENIQDNYCKVTDDTNLVFSMA